MHMCQQLFMSAAISTGPLVRELVVAIIILQRLSTSRILRDHEALDDSVH